MLSIFKIDSNLKTAESMLSFLKVLPNEKKASGQDALQNNWSIIYEIQQPERLLSSVKVYENQWLFVTAHSPQQQ